MFIKFEPRSLNISGSELPKRVDQMGILDTLKQTDVRLVEALLFANFLREERKTWIPKLSLSRARESGSLGFDVVL